MASGGGEIILKPLSEDVDNLNISPSNSKDKMADPMMDLDWFHPHLSRHAADCMLIDNAPEGSYLLRPSNDGEYALSVKMSASVQHVHLHHTKDGYKFGQSAFNSVKELRRHFEVEKPVIGGESGITVHLKFPYSRNCDEEHLYLDIVTHTVTRLTDRGAQYASMKRPEPAQSVAFPISSREGYLTKVGRMRKTWKIRWFVLRNDYLSYYKNRQATEPVRKLNLKEATDVKIDHTKGKQNCISITFPWRTFYLIADTPEDCDQWLSLIMSKTRRLSIGDTFSENV
ncbi:dual adapter for phosphotyrosine and 3-phosphotyrosine and 3-phosphoinositide-like [Dysidea avara]|uniref:dual adapter for phosphotyrosine and 3-phosphotyrosine and 3-phosphoinositide-like n=1 Tax=Dysidea avara TaxID=196820 RepID=UPI00333164CB